MHNLLRRPSGFYFRIKIPQSLRPVLGKRFLVRALGTTELLTARAAASVLYLQCRNEFHRLGGLVMKGPKVSDLLKNLKRNDIDELYKLENITRRGVGSVTADTKEEISHALAEIGKIDFSKFPDVPGATFIPPPAPKGENLYPLIKKFLRDVKPSGIKDKTSEAYSSTLELFKCVVSDKPIDGIADEDIDAFKDFLTIWPVNAHKRQVFKKKSPSEIVKLNEVHKFKTLHTQTRHHHIKRLNTFFLWCIKERKLKGINPLQGRSSVITKRGSGSAANKATRNRGYRDGKLEKIFNPKFYLAFTTPADYWCPLLMLFTGARINEIAQLYCADVKHHGTIDYISIHANRPDMSVKNFHAVRFVPLHPKLVSLGFVEYVGALKKAGHARVFPELPHHKANGYGDAAAGHFDSYLKGIGEKEEGKITHAFRHLFQDTLKQDGVHPDLIEELVGHGLPGQKPVYTNVMKLPKKLDAVKRANFAEVNFAKLKVPAKNFMAMIAAPRQ